MIRRVPVLAIALLALSVSVLSRLDAQGSRMRPTVPSPIAASLGKFGDVPVNLYTGVPSIGIPLFTAKGKSLELPISLSYHASGIKVDEIGSWVGMGWSLDAGGVITRTVRGRVDEQNYGYYNEGHTFYDDSHWPTPTSQILLNLQQDVLDGEPDQFFYNFAGMSGEIAIGPTTINQNVKDHVTIPYRRWRIVPGFGLDGITSWTITTEDGTQYTFGEVEKSRDWWWVYGGDMGVDHPPYNSSWHLTKIRAVGGDSILFTYAFYGAEHYRGLTQEKYDDTGGQCPGLPPFNQAEFQNQSYVESKRVRTITTAQHVVTFADSLRMDAISPAMESRWVPNGARQEPLLYRITVTTPDAQPAVLRRFAFEYDYSIGNRLTLLKVFEEDGSTPANRLPPYSFTYSGPALPPRATWFYHFYNGTAWFPIDHWGHYNGRTSVTNNRAVPSSRSPTTPPFHGFWLTGADRKPDSNYAKAGVLTKIVYPTGGFSEFDYELNDFSTIVDGSPLIDETAPKTLSHTTNHNGYTTTPFTIAGTQEVWVKVWISLPPWSDPPPICANGDPINPCPWGDIKRVSPAQTIRTWYGPGSGAPPPDSVLLAPGNYTIGASDGGNPVTISIGIEWTEQIVVTKKKAGGLRIRAIKTGDGMGNVSVRKFRYLQGDLVRSSGIIGSEPHYDFWLYAISGNGTPCWYYNRSSQSRIPLGGGPSVSYSDVTELHGTESADGVFGQTRHTFTAGGDPAPTGYWPYLRRTSNEWRRGQETSVGQYDSIARLQQVAFRSYEFPEPTQTTRKFRGYSVSTMSGVMNCSQAFGVCFPLTAWNSFLIVSGLKLTTNQLRHTFDTLGVTKISDSTRFIYGNPNHAQLTETIETNSDGLQRVTRMKYPADYTIDGTPVAGSEAAALAAMQDVSPTGVHMPGVLIERTVSVKSGASDRVVQAEITTFKEFGLRQFLPYRRYVLNSPSPIP